MRQLPWDELVRRRMVPTGRAHRKQLRALKRNKPNLTLVKISYGYYFDATALPPNLPPWEIRLIVTFARMFAIEGHYGNKDTTVLFTAECAAAARGVPTFWNNPDIAYRANMLRKHRRKLPSVTIAGVRVPPVDTYHVTGGVTVSLSEVTKTRGGLLLTSPDVTVADEARRGSRCAAYLIACTILTQITSYNWKNPRPARQAAEKIRKAWLQKAEEIRRERCYQVFRAVVKGMETGVFSPIEAIALWAIKSVLPERKWSAVYTQHLVETKGRVRYYLDIAFPDEKVAVETDGRIKYGTTPDQVGEYAARHTNRHQDLADDGWTIRHLTSDQLNSVVVVWVVAETLQALGILRADRPPKPRGPLYEAPTAQMYSRDRRF